jgi:proline iminopeptidase
MGIHLEKWLCDITGKIAHNRSVLFKNLLIKTIKAELVRAGLAENDTFITEENAESYILLKRQLTTRLSGEDRDMLDLVMESMETEEAGTKELFRILNPYYVHSVAALARKTKTKSNAEVNRIMGKDIMEHYNLKSDLHRLADISVLVVQGESDMITPEKINELLMQYLPNAELTVIKECGHWTVVEKPGEFIEIVRGFFR